MKLGGLRQVASGGCHLPHAPAPCAPVNKPPSIGQPRHKNVWCGDASKIVAGVRQRVVTCFLAGRMCAAAPAAARSAQASLVDRARSFPSPSPVDCSRPQRGLLASSTKSRRSVPASFRFWQAPGRTLFMEHQGSLPLTGLRYRIWRGCWKPSASGGGRTPRGKRSLPRTPPHAGGGAHAHTGLQSTEQEIDAGAHSLRSRKDRSPTPPALRRTGPPVPGSPPAE